MLLRCLVFLLASCFSQIISLEDKYEIKHYHSIIACLATNCSDYQQTKMMYTFNSTRFGDLTNQQFTIQFFVKLNPQVNNSFIAQVKTGLQKLELYQSSSNKIIIKDILSNHSFDLYQITFKANNWLSIYIINTRIIVSDYGTFQYVYLKNFIYSSSTKFNLYNNGREHWQGQGCCIIFYQGISYLDSYNYIQYNNKKPKAKLVLNIQQKIILQFPSDYHYIIILGQSLGIDNFDPEINTDNLQFQNNQYIFANDVQLNQQFTMEFKIAQPSTFKSNVVLLNYSLPNWNLYIFLNQTQVTLKQNNFTKSFTLISQVHYHFCIAVAQTLEENFNYYYTQFYQFSDSAILAAASCYTCQENCRKCDYINSNIVCLECIQGHFIQNNNCILCSQICKNCKSLQVCTSCPINDTIPDQEGICPQCQIGEQLQDGACRTVCGDGILGQGEGCDFGQQNGQMRIMCVLESLTNKLNAIMLILPQKLRFKLIIFLRQLIYSIQATELLCQSFQIRIDNFTQDEFNYTFTIENEKCNFQFNYKKTITESNLIRILVPQTLSRLLESNPREIVIIPRRQIYYSVEQVEQSKNVQSAQNWFKMLIQLFGPLLALLGGFSYYLTILDILSWINNLYYINIQFPLNVQLIFQNSPWDDIQLFPIQALPQFNQPSDPYYRGSPPHFLEKGTDFQLILGSLILGYFIAQLIIKALSRKNKKSIITIQLQKIGTEQQYLQQVREQKFVSNNQQKIFINIITKCKFFIDNTFSYFIKLLNLCYLDLVSAIALQLYCFDLSLLHYKMILLNYVLAYTSVILCLYLLRLTWIACNQHLILLKSKRFMQIYGTLFEKTQKPMINLLFYTHLQIQLEIYFYNKPLFQTGFSCLISFINVAFIIGYKPFESVKTLIQYGVPDICIFLLMLVFTICAIDDRVSVLSDNTRYNIGWLIISIILISTIVQLYFIMKQLIKDLTDRVQRLFTKIKQLL